MTALTKLQQGGLEEYKRASQLPLDLDLAIAEAIEGLAEAVHVVEGIQDPGRNGHDCEAEVTCHADHGLNGGGAFAYVCGFRIAGTVWGCPRRRRLETGCKNALQGPGDFDGLQKPCEKGPISH